MNHLGDYDVIVIGAGHAGIEAAHAAAMLGAKTAVFTLSLDAIGNLPPRHQREIPLKETLALLQQQSAPAREPFLVLFWYTKRTSLYEKSIEEK